jgi:hypothetical protein
MSLPRTLLVGLIVCACLAGAGSARAQAPSAWVLMEGVPKIRDSYGDLISLDSITMADPYNGWVVSATRDVTRVYRLTYRQGRWTVSWDSGMPGPIDAFAAVSADEAWLMGGFRANYHRTSAGWITRSEPEPGADIYVAAVDMSPSGDTGWAVGDSSDAVLLRYATGRWERDWSLSAAGALRDVDIEGATGWAVGATLWRYAEGRWSQAAMPAACPQEPCGAQLSVVDTISDREAWALGQCTACPGRSYVIHYLDGVWSPVTIMPASASVSWYDLAFNRYGAGLAVGVESIAKDQSKTVLYRFANNQWIAEPLPGPQAPRPQVRAPKVALLDTGHALVADMEGIWTYGYSSAPPAAAVPPSGQSDALYFDVVGHTLRGSFQAAWERNGSLPVFGYPLTEQFPEANADTGTVYATQYLERQRFEYHPENAGTPYEVLLGRLGVEVLAQQGRDYRAFPKASPAAPHYVAETGQEIAPEFWDYWRSHGLDFGDPGVSAAESLALFGYPISPAGLETNADGDTVLTQWYERARFEYHPGKPLPDTVLLGRLSAETLAKRGWIEP